LSAGEQGHPALLVGGLRQAARPTRLKLPKARCMKTVVKIVKRGIREQLVAVEEGTTPKHSPSDMVKTVKAWITESRERRNDKANFPLWLQEARKEMRMKGALTSSFQME